MPPIATETQFSTAKLADIGIILHGEHSSGREHGLGTIWGVGRHSAAFR